MLLQHSFSRNFWLFSKTMTDAVSLKTTWLNEVYSMNPKKMQVCFKRSVKRLRGRWTLFRFEILKPPTFSVCWRLQLELQKHLSQNSSKTADSSEQSLTVGSNFGLWNSRHSQSTVCTLHTVCSTQPRPANSRTNKLATCSTHTLRKGLNNVQVFCGTWSAVVICLRDQTIGILLTRHTV